MPVAASGRPCRTVTVYSVLAASASLGTNTNDSPCCSKRPATLGATVKCDWKSAMLTPAWSNATSMPVLRRTFVVSSPGAVDATLRGQAACTAQAASAVPSVRTSSKR